MMKAKIEKILTEAFSPEHLSVLDDSHKHAGHNPHAKKGGTHFTIEITSKSFVGKSPLERHRMIYAALQVPLDEGVHALAIKAKPTSV
jgi:BolA family transcriptional regulator, general stress-responsive regulator